MTYNVNLPTYPFQGMQLNKIPLSQTQNQIRVAQSEEKELHLKK